MQTLSFDTAHHAVSRLLPEFIFYGDDKFTQEA